MIERLRESKWVYVLLSVLLAVIFWYYVRAELDPSQPTWFRDVPVVQSGGTVLTRQGLTVAGLSHDTVDIRVEAPASVIESLMRNRKDISVVIDVSRCEEGENKLVYTPSWPSNVNTENLTRLDQEPDIITVTVDKLYTSTFNVEFQLRGSVAKGYQAGVAAVNPETVIVSGAVDQVSQVAKVVAILEENDLSERFAGDLPLVLLDKDGNPLTDLEVTLSADSAYVVLPIVVVKEIPLTVNVLSGGGATQDDVEIKIEPSSIMVSGAEEDLRDLTEISLGSVDLSKIISSSVLSRTIELDPSLENASGVTSATITVTISGLATRDLEVSNIVRSNVPDGYTVDVVTKARTVTIRGKAEDLEAVDASQIRIVADMSEITTVGTYPVPVRVYLDAGSSVGVIGEYNIIVNVSR